MLICFMNVCFCVSLYVSLRSQVILILCVNLCFSCILCVEFLFPFAFIMYFECHCFMYVGVNTSTRKYLDIACGSWRQYIHT